MVNIELIAGPWCGKVVNYPSTPKTVTATCGHQAWTYKFTGRHNANGDQLWAQVSGPKLLNVKEQA